MLWSRINNGANSNYHYVTRKKIGRAQEKTDTSMQGRVFGLLGTMYAGFLPIGMAMFGPLADILPLQWIMIGSGIALIVIAGIAYYSRELKTI